MEYFLLQFEQSTIEMKVLSSVAIFIIVCAYIPYNFVKGGKLENKVLSRAKRYLAFPTGASCVVEICLASQTYIYNPSIFTEDVGWGLVYGLPNGSKPFLDFYLPKFLKKRRHRRDLYGKVEKIMNSMGYNGRECVLRSLCEASQRFLPKEDNLANLILKILFQYPHEKLLPSEPEEHRLYHWASRLGQENYECVEQFSCPFSLIDMALGQYTPTT